jgi:hypothetical protein
MRLRKSEHTSQHFKDTFAKTVHWTLPSQSDHCLKIQMTIRTQIQQTACTDLRTNRVVPAIWMRIRAANAEYDDETRPYEVETRQPDS